MAAAEEARERRREQAELERQQKAVEARLLRERKAAAAAHAEKRKEAEQVYALRRTQNQTFILDTDGKQNLIYKHAISTITPFKPVSILDAYDKEEE